MGRPRAAMTDDSGPAVDLDDLGQDGRLSQPSPVETPNLELATDELFTAQVRKTLNLTQSDYSTFLSQPPLPISSLRTLLHQIHATHNHDPNFPSAALTKIEIFLRDEDEIVACPAKFRCLIWEMRVMCWLVLESSPYAGVRAVVSSGDDGDMLCGTLRAWMIGLLLSGILTLVNQFFSMRSPALFVTANLAQVLAYPIAKAWEYALPDRDICIGTIRIPINPGAFTGKEHMLIAIMASVSQNTPHINLAFWLQYLDAYLGRGFASGFGYQFLLTLSTTFVGYGVAGLCRTFLVDPALCIWPASLATIGLNTAFHPPKTDALPVRTPGGGIWTISRLRFIVVAGGAMFFYYFLPGFAFSALSNFNWITWIAPRNAELAAVTGFNNGVGINPWPTFDWNTLLKWDCTDPLTIPFHATMNKFVGAGLSVFVVMGMWFGNAFHTAYLPINMARLFDNYGGPYDARSVLDERGFLSVEKYEAYSPVFLTAGQIVKLLMSFAVYPAILLYTILYHRHHLVLSFRSLVRQFRSRDQQQQGESSASEPDYFHSDEHIQDTHTRKMLRYKPVPHWWYISILLPALAFGLSALAAYETDTSPAVAIYGVLLGTLFVVPVALVAATTGVTISIETLAALLGGTISPGNPMAMTFLRTFAHSTCSHAVLWLNDFKLAQYLHISPRQTFVAQVTASLLSSLVGVAVTQIQMRSVRGICTASADIDMSCGALRGYFETTVLWGVIGPSRLWGKNGIYREMLIGFPLGVAVVLLCYFLMKRFSARRMWLRSVHPVALLYGATLWAPFNLSYVLPCVPIGWFSWVFLRRRFVGFWSKYNFSLSAAFSTSILCSTIVIYFAFQWNGLTPQWWGTTVNQQGCESLACTLLRLGGDGMDYFGPRNGSFG